MNKSMIKRKRWFLFCLIAVLSLFLLSCAETEDVIKVPSQKQIVKELDLPKKVYVVAASENIDLEMAIAVQADGAMYDNCVDVDDSSVNYAKKGRYCITCVGYVDYRLLLNYMGFDGYMVFLRKTGLIIYDGLVGVPTTYKVTVFVISEKKAEKLTAEGIPVWTSNNDLFGSEE